MTESSIIFYTTTNGQVSIQVQYEDGSFWLTQKRMAELFGVESHTITYHLKEIYQSVELQIDSTTRKIRVVQQEGKREVSRELDFYNLDAISNSTRQWKSQRFGGQVESRTGIRNLSKIQDENYISDFDNEIKRIQGKEK